MAKTQKKIRNWNEYNNSLVKRGQILLSFNENYLEQLYYREGQKRGGQKIYSAQMYEYLLAIKVILRLPWRATVGFAKGLLQKAFPGEVILIPDYAHASREVGKLRLKIKPQAIPKGGFELAFDSTGVNVYSTSGYHQRKYGQGNLYRKREQWKKIHLVLELNSMQIMSMVYTGSGVNDCEVVKELCAPIKDNINSVRADGAYDTEEFHQMIYDFEAEAMIPPAITSKAQDELKNKPKRFKEFLKPRDGIIKWIREHESFEEGLKQWKIRSGYHRRSLIEACMFRFKRIFGFNLQHKNETHRKNEIIMKINLLNQMAALGRPRYG